MLQVEYVENIIFVFLLRHKKWDLIFRNVLIFQTCHAKKKQYKKLFPLHSIK